MRALVIGCGYIGFSLAKELVTQGHEVYGVRRSPESKTELESAGIKPIFADVTNTETLAALPLPFDWVVNTCASTHGGAEEYRSVYLEGTRNLLSYLSKSPPKKYVYTSSTSVYEQVDGTLVSETAAVQPTVPTAQILVETENLLLSAFRESRFPAVVLRVAGIYGPDRGYYLSQFLSGNATVSGSGERFINMAHRDDVVGTIIAALKNGRPGEIYNVADDEPVRQVNFYRWMSETLGREMPPFVPESAETRKRAATNKRVSNRKLKMELGYRFKYGSFRAGCTAEIKRLEDLGIL